MRCLVAHPSAHVRVHAYPRICGCTRESLVTVGQPAHQSIVNPNSNTKKVMRAIKTTSCSSLRLRASAATACRYAYKDPPPSMSRFRYVGKFSDLIGVPLDLGLHKRKALSLLKKGHQKPSNVTAKPARGSGGQKLFSIHKSHACGGVTERKWTWQDLYPTKVHTQGATLIAKMKVTFR